MSNLRKIIIISFLLIVSLIFYYFYLEEKRKEFKVTFLDVGQGDAALIQFENKEKILVDCGPNKMILSALSRNMTFYDRKIDYLLVSHNDLDHYGGCIDVLKRYEVKEIFITDKEKPEDPYFLEWKKYVLQKGIKTTKVQGGQNFIIFNSVLKILAPDPGLVLKSDDMNNHSIVFKLDSNNRDFLFTGDMEEELEKMLVNKYCQSQECPNLRSEVLKVGHHGADSSTTENFVKHVKPDEAVISVGEISTVIHLLES